MQMTFKSEKDKRACKSGGNWTREVIGENTWIPSQYLAFQDTIECVNTDNMHRERISDSLGIEI